MTQLSEQVTISLKEAQTNLREALGFASKTEEPRINIAISQILEATEQVMKHYEKGNMTFEEMMRQRFNNF
jgi:hypothetical protein